MGKYGPSIIFDVRKETEKLSVSVIKFNEFIFYECCRIKENLQIGETQIKTIKTISSLPCSVNDRLSRT